VSAGRPHEQPHQRCGQPVLGTELLVRRFDVALGKLEEMSEAEVAQPIRQAALSGEAVSER
jgi:hypothetical protein